MNVGYHIAVGLCDTQIACSALLYFVVALHTLFIVPKQRIPPEHPSLVQVGFLSSRLQFPSLQLLHIVFTALGMSNEIVLILDVNKAAAVE